MKNNNLLSIPRGLRDILPAEAAEREVIQRKLRNTFKSWGYGQIITPVFEYYSSLSSEAGETIEREMFKFFDRDGSLLALRPEMTTPIARAVAQRLKGKGLPQRLFYLANVFREEMPQRGQQRQFCQAGVELIGSREPIADAEVLAVMIDSLRSLGLKGFQVGVGQIEFFRGAVESANISERDQTKIREAIVKRDLVGLERLTGKLSLPSSARDGLIEIPTLRGREEIIDKAQKYVTNKRSQESLENLAEVYRLLKTFGAGDFIILDLGIIRNFDYYTGVIFEAYAAGLGFPIGGGGRYDNLLSEFEFDTPAAGFALGLDRLHITLAEQGVVQKKPVSDLALYCTKDMARLLMVAGRLRSHGLKVESVLGLSNSKSAQKLAKERGIKWVGCADNASQLKLDNLITGESKVCLVEKVKGELK